MRMMFKASVEYGKVYTDNNSSFLVQGGDDVQTTDGWKPVEDLRVGDTLLCSDDGVETVKKVKNVYEKPDNIFAIEVREVVLC